jgi:hypothetical protein
MLEGRVTYETKKKACFVVMGFGEKTDYQSNPQRVLNLNRTFEDIIEPAVTAAGLECVRADTIIHSTVIDKPMYEHLLGADVVVADLSTSNANAIYELGVRHALRPHTTIVIAEERFSFPFDLNHVSITRYEHLGKEIGFREVMRMREILQKKIAVILEKAETDSPVFMFLPQLLANRGAALPPPAPTAPRKDEKSFADLLQAFNDAKRDVKQWSDWLAVAAVLRRLQKLQPNDPYIVQQLALATYKSRHPDVLTSLHDARATLSVLKPDTSSDAETVGLWGAIHKRLWETGRNPRDLDTAIRSYAKGYFIRDDYYNGINFAFLLNVRGTIVQGDEAIADRVLARRVRAEVLTLCDAALDQDRSALGECRSGAAQNPQDLFWIKATKVEALLGLGRTIEAEALKARLVQEEPPPPQWAVDSMIAQLDALVALNP